MCNDKSVQVQQMFAGIARRYDFLNHCLSLGTDILWRRAATRRLARLGAGGAPRLILDLCCGTGDMAIALARLGQVVGCDFCAPMLELARRKTARRRLAWPVMLVEGDALELPFADGTFDMVTVAFGVRNYRDVPAGLREIRRVLRPGGVAGILEFSQPALPLFREVFRFYFHHLLPRLGQWVSGQAGPYHYLPDSVRQFPDAPAFQSVLTAAGFQRTGFKRYTFGVAAFHFGYKAFDNRTDLR